MKNLKNMHSKIKKCGLKKFKNIVTNLIINRLSTELFLSKSTYLALGIIKKRVERKCINHF